MTVENRNVNKAGWSHQGGVEPGLLDQSFLIVVIDPLRDASRIQFIHQGSGSNLQDVSLRTVGQGRIIDAYNRNSIDIYLSY